jgi:hypothetical protein
MLLVDDLSEFHWSDGEDGLHTYCVSDLTFRGLAKASPEIPRPMSGPENSPGEVFSNALAL